jgi:hypothetical protein
VLGHLTLSAEAICKVLDVPPRELEGYRDLFGPESELSDDPSRYPGRAELIENLTVSHNRAAEALRNASDELLNSPAPQGVREQFPTVGEFVTFMMTSHEGMHLGHVAVWRRVLKLEPLMEGAAAS